MKLLSLTLFLFSLSFLARANPDCEKHRQEFPRLKAAVLVYQELQQLEEAKLKQMKKDNEGFFGDLMTSDRLIQLMELQISQTSVLVTTSKIAYTSTRMLYSTCMTSLGYSISTKEIEAQIDPLDLRFEILNLKMKLLNQAENSLSF